MLVDVSRSTWALNEHHYVVNTFAMRTLSLCPQCEMQMHTNLLWCFAHFFVDSIVLCANIQMEVMTNIRLAIIVSIKMKLMHSISLHLTNNYPKYTYDAICRYQTSDRVPFGHDQVEEPVCIAYFMLMCAYLCEREKDFFFPIIAPHVHFIPCIVSIWFWFNIHTLYVVGGPLKANQATQPQRLKKKNDFVNIQLVDVGKF